MRLKSVSRRDNFIQYFVSATDASMARRKSLGLGGLPLGTLLQIGDAPQNPERHFREIGTGGMQIEYVVDPVGKQAQLSRATTGARP